jgi:HPt (histidine-containing phosphotransfer) domain-containing protein
MSVGLEHHLHFHCTFELSAISDEHLEWADIPKLIRQWIAKRLEASGVEVNEAFWKAWLFHEGEWKPPRAPRVLVQTKRMVGTGLESAPQYWALRYEHPDSVIKFRTWRTDIGVSQIGQNSWEISFTTLNWLLPGFIGREPEAPVPTAPGIIRMLLKDQRWQAYAGDQLLMADPIRVPAGRADVLVHSLISQSRHCPVVVVSQEYSSGKALVNAQRIAKLLTGAAVVFEYSSTLIDREMEYLLDRDYRCWNGMVRVYQPHLEPNPRRHRFFTKWEIEELGSIAIEDQLVRGIARRSRIFVESGIAAVEDVVSRRREEKLAQLRGNADAAELLPLFEQENNELMEQIRKEKCEVEYWKGRAEEAEELEDEIRRLAHEKKTLQNRVDEVQRQAEIALTRAAFVDHLESLPSSVSDVVTMVGQAFPGKIVFTEKAQESAKNARLKNPNIAWKALRAMATRLYELHFIEKLPFREIIEKFQSETNFELAATESQRTRTDKHLAAQRTDTYKGKKIDISPHLKYGRDPGNTLRIHYCALTDDKVIVIGHCGDHLNTTRTN